jgi:hypothetical protein
MARTHRCPGWLGATPRIAVSRRAMAPHNRPVSPSAITDNPGSVSIATGSRFSAVSPSSAGNRQDTHHLRVDAVSNRPGRRTANSPLLLLLLLLLLLNN